MLKQSPQGALLIESYGDRGPYIKPGETHYMKLSSVAMLQQWSERQPLDIMLKDQKIIHNLSLMSGTMVLYWRALLLKSAGTIVIMWVSPCAQMQKVNRITMTLCYGYSLSCNNINKRKLREGHWRHTAAQLQTVRSQVGPNLSYMALILEVITIKCTVHLLCTLYAYSYII